MKQWRYDDKCDRECFANRNGHCWALVQTPVGECGFRRTDITIQEQVEDMSRHNSIRSLRNE